MCIPLFADRSLLARATSNKNRRGHCENKKNIINISGWEVAEANPQMDKRMDRNDGCQGCNQAMNSIHMREFNNDM